MHRLIPFTLIQIEKFPIPWRLVDAVPVISTSFTCPLLNWLHLSPGLLVPEHFRQLIVKLDVDVNIFFPAPKALMRALEEIEMNTRQLAPIIYAPSIGIIFGDLLEDLFMHAHCFGVGADGSIEFRTQSVDLQSGFVEQSPNAA